MPTKRKYSSMSRGSRGGRMSGRYQKTSFRKYGNKIRRLGYKGGPVARLQRIERTIETKESAFNLGNQQVAHNNVYIWGANILETNNGAGDPMTGIGSRIGDQITLQGLAATFFVEASLERSKVHFRIMLLRGARGASFNRADIFKGMSNNKMIDQLNTEKYSVVAQKRFNVSAPNAVASAIPAIPGNGVPTASTPAGITGNKIVKFWIPGRKFGRDGVIKYENISGNVKFYDYRWVILAYDWYGTLQDVNNVGFINEAWTKMYFKDA